VTRTRFDQAQREAGGDPPDGPFRGVPILFKDLGCTVAGTLAQDALTEFAHCAERQGIAEGLKPWQRWRPHNQTPPRRHPGRCRRRDQGDDRLPPTARPGRHRPPPANRPDRDRQRALAHILGGSHALAAADAVAYALGQTH
jgi:hypothetical protein